MGPVQILWDMTTVKVYGWSEFKNAFRNRFFKFHEKYREIREKNLILMRENATD